MVATDMLFPGSPSMYRHRWIKLCKLLLVCDYLRLTPGGMRGGEDWLNRTAKGASVSDIQCRMRITHLQTLEA